MNETVIEPFKLFDGGTVEMECPRCRKRASFTLVNGESKDCPFCKARCITAGPADAPGFHFHGPEEPAN